MGTRSKYGRDTANDGWLRRYRPNPNIPRPATMAMWRRRRRRLERPAVNTKGTSCAYDKCGPVEA